MDILKVFLNALHDLLLHYKVEKDYDDNYTDILGYYH